jgi:hypothetical protein
MNKEMSPREVEEALSLQDSDINGTDTTDQSPQLSHEKKQEARICFLFFFVVLSLSAVLHLLSFNHSILAPYADICYVYAISLIFRQYCELRITENKIVCHLVQFALLILAQTYIIARDSH